MSGIFKPGQLVKVNEAMMSSFDRLELFNVPAGIGVENDQVRIIGWLGIKDVALLVSRGRTLSGDVYVVGPNGGGWAPGAYLKII
jgi:hypothetical protein